MRKLRTNSPAATVLAALAVICLIPTLAAAQSWPQRQIKMIVPFPAGGGTDLIGRLAAKHIGDRLGQQVYVENRCLLYTSDAADE